MEQRIACWPFAVNKLRGSNRQDFVFIRPPVFQTGPLSSEWIVFGSARFYSGSKWSRKRTWAGKGTREMGTGEMGTIQFSMSKESSDFLGAACDSKKDAGDGNQWWYINSWAMKWATCQ
jgi:hypothetical protein